IEPWDCPPTRNLFNHNVLDYSFDAQAPPPERWLRFLREVWPDDPESITTLQDWFGYCLLPDTSRQKILFLYGPTRTGKGTIARVLREMIGPANVCGPTLASLGTPFGLWPLLNKSVAIISDARISGSNKDQDTIVERLLSISGEDALTIDRKYLDLVTTKL